MSINKDLEDYKADCLAILSAKFQRETKKDLKTDPLEKVVEKYLNDAVKH